MIRFVTLVTIVQAVVLAADSAEYRGKVFLGVSGESVELPASDEYESTHGLKLTRIAALSTGDKAGLKIGDIIVSLDGKAWTDDQIRLSRSFGMDEHKARPGDTLKAVILRDDALITTDLALAPYPRTARDDDPTNAQLRPDLVDRKPVYESLCWKLIDKAGLTDDCNDLLGRIDRSARFPDPDRLAMMRYVHRDAFKIEAVTREIAAPYLAGEVTIDKALAQVQSVLITFDRREPAVVAPEVDASFANADLEGHLDYIEAVLDAAGQAYARAFAKISKEDRQFILDHREAMIDSFVDHKMLSYDKDGERQANSVKLLDLAGKVDMRALCEQAMIARRLVDPAFVASLRAAVAASGKDLAGETVVERKTPHGLIRIAGNTRNRHTDHCAALYDLGGDDIYANNQGASMPAGDSPIHTAVLIDYEGNDAYESPDSFSQGCGDLGVGMLVDLAGNDRYTGIRFGQGAGFMGIGVLIDFAGDDVYRGIEMHQGVGHHGAGVLIDRAGRDRYEAHIASQGAGLPAGFGLLVDTGDDNRGNDTYYCKGNQKSGYGTAGVFEGWGQGVGFGYRPYASGGVGAIIDTAGNDRFEAGNFSQGGGYFYGFGMIYNAGGDDEYIGSRYAQGFTAHQAAGAFIDTAGNDIYSTRYAVAQGLSWDETVTLFIDQQGDDIYEGGSFSQGASAMNGIALFFDLAGRDTYLYCDQARAGGNHYHGGTSLSFFIDAGGDEDTYPSKPNNRILTGKEHFIFIDLPVALSADIDDAQLDRLLNDDN